MNYPININEVDNQVEDHLAVLTAYKEATVYLKNFKWCKAVKDCTLYTNLGDILCIFLFEIDNVASADDNYLWVVVGDLPSMYLDVHGARTTLEVLEDYTTLAEQWIKQVKIAGSLENCYPFRAEPTIEMAELLEKRVNFIKNTVMENIDDIGFNH